MYRCCTNGGWPSSAPPKGHGSQFSAHICCGQMAAWIKMLLGMEVCLGTDVIVLDGDPAPPPQKGRRSPSSIFGQCLSWPNGWMDQDAQPPVFSSCLLWPNGWMDEDATWYGSRPQPRPHCIRRTPSAPQKGYSSPPLFGPCLLWPRSPISATAELLYKWSPKIKIKKQLGVKAGMVTPLVDKHVGGR